MGNSARKVHTRNPCSSSRRKPWGWWVCNLAYCGSLCCSRSKSRSVFYHLPRAALPETSDNDSLRYHSFSARVHAQLLQLWQSLCDPVDCSPSHSSVHGILQARILEWVAMPYSRGSSPPRDQTRVSCVTSIAGKFFTHWAAQEAP